MTLPRFHRPGAALLLLFFCWLPLSAQSDPDAPRVLFTAASLADVQNRLAAGEPRAATQVIATNPGTVGESVPGDVDDPTPTDVYTHSRQFLRLRVTP